MANLVRWSRWGVLFAGLQALSQLAIAVEARSEGMAAFAALAAALTAGAVRLHGALRAGALAPAQKYFFIAHMLLSTWTFLLGMLTLLLHAHGVAVLAVLFDADASNDLRGDLRALVAPLFALTLASMAGDLYAVTFHTARLRGTEPLEELPVLAGRLTAAVDGGFVLLAALAWRASGDGGMMLPLLVALCSGGFSARHAVALSGWAAAPGDAASLPERHLFGQLLALQHALSSSFVFLVTLGVLLASSLGISARAALTGMTPTQTLTVVSGCLGYVGLLVTAVVCVGLHSQVCDSLGGGTGFRGIGPEEGAGQWGEASPAGGSWAAEAVALPPLAGSGV